MSISIPSFKHFLESNNSLLLVLIWHLIALAHLNITEKMHRLHCRPITDLPIWSPSLCGHDGKVAKKLLTTNGNVLGLI